MKQFPATFSINQVLGGFVVLLLALLWVLPAQPVQAQEDLTICFAFESLESQFWVAGRKAIVDTLRAQGINVIEHNARGNANRQLEQVRSCIGQGVDGIILIPKDGQLAVTIAGIANQEDIPIGVFNRPPASSKNHALLVTADQLTISRKAMSYLAEQARERYERTGEKVKPLHLVGDLGDPNAVKRRKGFRQIVEENSDIFTEPVEAKSNWDPATAQRNLQAAIQANPDVELLFVAAEFLYPQVRAVLRRANMWHKEGNPNHVILGGVDGNELACEWLEQGYADASAVQDLFREAEMLLNLLTTSIRNGETQPDAWMLDPGFALTQANFEERAMDMWGCKLLAETRGVDSIVSTPEGSSTTFSSELASRLPHLLPGK